MHAHLVAIVTAIALLTQPAPDPDPDPVAACEATHAITEAFHARPHEDSRTFWKTTVVWTSDTDAVAQIWPPSFSTIP